MSSDTLVETPPPLRRRTEADAWSPPSKPAYARLQEELEAEKAAHSSTIKAYRQQISDIEREKDNIRVLLERAQQQLKRPPPEQGALSLVVQALQADLDSERKLRKTLESEKAALLTAQSTLPVLRAAYEALRTIGAKAEIETGEKT